MSKKLTRDQKIGYAETMALNLRLGKGYLYYSVKAKRPEKGSAPTDVCWNLFVGDVAFA